MADNSAIEWCDATWQPITGCSVVSPGCTNCYAMRLAGTRLRHHPSRAGLTRDSKAGPIWTGEVRFNKEWLDQPLRWKRSRRIFVCAHGDLFAENVPDEWIDRVFAVMALAPRHTFLVLTKRAQRMRAWFANEHSFAAGDGSFSRGGKVASAAAEIHATKCRVFPAWPLPNVWLAVSVEDQARADERIPLLLDTPAAKRFLSCEPLLGPVNLQNLTLPTKWPRCDCQQHSPTFNALDGSIYCAGCCEGPAATTSPGLDWVIAGGESGPVARPMHPDWARSLRDQCGAAGVPFFFKQWGEWTRCGFDGPHEPASLHHLFPDGELALRVGKKAAGRLLDGREWNEVPSR